MKRVKRTAPWLLVAATMLAACSTTAAPGSASSGASDPAPASRSPLPSPSSVSLLPLGSYTADIPAGLEAAAGQWRMTIADDGITWVNPETGATFSPGDVLEVSADTVVFAPDPGCPGQDDGATSGTYAWELEGSELRFTVEADSCAGRRDTLIAAPWTLAD